MKTLIEFENGKGVYTYIENKIPVNFNYYFIFIIVFICLLFSTLFTILQNFDYKPIKELAKFKRIKKNMGSWFNLTKEKTGIEINKGRLLYTSKPYISEFKCIDYGLYYAVGRLNPNTFLPEFVRRGNSGPWLINKSSSSDLSAQQMCTFILNKYTIIASNEELITCGTDMFNKLGYSGYFIPNSVCELTLEKLSLESE